MIRIVEMNEDNVSGVALLERMNFDDGWSENSLREELNNENALYLVAYDELTDKVIGAAGLIQSFDEGEILNVSVMKEYRRRSVGSKLLEEIILRGTKRGIASFTLEVREGNEGARKLYEKSGFVFEGIRPNFYSNPSEGACIYWLRK